MHIQLSCDTAGCASHYLGPAIAIDRHHSRRLRAAAHQHGWRVVRFDHCTIWQDLCPACAPQARGHLRPDLMRRVWSQPTERAAEELGVSGKAVEKRCRQAGVPKPPRGFWRKYERGQMEECRDLVPYEVVQVLGPGFLDEVFPLT